MRDLVREGSRSARLELKFWVDSNEFERSMHKISIRKHEMECGVLCFIGWW